MTSVKESMLDISSAESDTICYSHIACKYTARIPAVSLVIAVSEGFAFLSSFLPYTVGFFIR